jgi:flagellar protein FliL
MAEADEDGGQPAKPKSKKKLIIIGAAAAVVLLGGAGGYFAFAGGDKEGHGAQDEAHAEAPSRGEGGHGEAMAATAPATFVELPEMTVNLATPDNQKPRYVRLNIALEVDKPEMAAAIKPMMPRVLDSFQTHLRELRPEDIRGSSGAYRLKEELLRRVNTAIAPARVEAVLFKDIVVQ